MNRRALAIAIILITGLAAAAPQALARKTRLKVREAVPDTMEMVQGSLMVCSPCAPCNEGYGLSQVRITGFDKRAESSSESFFITNTTDRRLVEVDLVIEYLDMTGRQLHKRRHTLPCDVPPGETRRADIPSFDRQKLFYYCKTPAPARRQATPFRVNIDISCFYLR